MFSLAFNSFASPNLYQIHIAKESPDEKSLRLARYFRFHLENKAEIPPLLLKTIASVEKTLANTHPGFFDMSTKDMDDYTQTIKNVNRKTPPPNSSQTMTQAETDNLLHGVSFDTTPPTSPTRTVTQNPPSHTTNTTDKNPHATPDTNFHDAPIHKPMELDDDTTNATTPIIRIETRWAPKDFKDLQASSDKFYERLYPILQCFQIENTSSLMEWQTDQLVSLDSPELACSTITKCLSIRLVTNSSQKCFYFSFRV